MKGRRSQYEIYWQILTYCKKPASFTSIIHNCNLNSKIAQEYLEFLLEKSYLTKTEQQDKTTYQSTEKAQDFLMLFSRLYHELFEKNP
jgi:predicted transcriptional regulator